MSHSARRSHVDVRTAVVSSTLSVFAAIAVVGYVAGVSGAGGWLYVGLGAVIAYVAVDVFLEQRRRNRELRLIRRLEKKMERRIK